MLLASQLCHRLLSICLSLWAQSREIVETSAESHSFAYLCLDRHRPFVVTTETDLGSAAWRCQHPGCVPVCQKVSHVLTLRPCVIVAKIHRLRGLATGQGS